MGKTLTDRRATLWADVRWEARPHTDDSRREVPRRPVAFENPVFLREAQACQLLDDRYAGESSVCMEGRALTMDSTWGSPGTVSALGGSGPWRAFRTYAQTHSYPPSSSGSARDSSRARASSYTSQTSTRNKTPGPCSRSWRIQVSRGSMANYRAHSQR